jgi:hypothetical protein
MKELLRTNDPTLIAFATHLLTGEGIPTFPLDVHMSILDGSIGILPQRLMVRSCPSGRRLPGQARGQRA